MGFSRYRGTALMRSSAIYGASGKHVLLALILLSGCLQPVRGDEAPFGRVHCEQPKSVHDGDTFRCLSGGMDFPVRVAGIDAPETGQNFWRVARDLLKAKLAKGAVVDCYKTDVKYGRQVCHVRGLDGHDIALELVKTGMAWHTVKYREEQTVSEEAAYATAEESARARGLGLWSQPDPQAPSDCRALRKQRKKCR